MTSLYADAPRELQTRLEEADALPLAPEISNQKRKIMNEQRWVSTEQARLITAAYRRHEEKHRILKRAFGLAASLEGIRLRIDPEELIVGNRSAGVRAGIVFPEAGLSWLEKEIETLPTREQDRFQVKDEDVRYFREELLPYWRGQTLEEGIAAARGEEIEAIGKVVKINQKDHAQGHIIPDVRTWLQKGPAGLLTAVKSRRERASGDTADFLESAAIVLEAAVGFIRRHGEHAEKLSRNPEHASHAANLGEIARICIKLASSPPENFREALQSVWFLFVILHLESNASSFSPGRLDQYLYPYFEKDLNEGRIDLASALALIESLWLGFNKIVYLRNSQGAKYFAGFPIGFNIALGGKNRDGSDSANLLSFLCLKAQEHLGLPQPNLSVRLHEKSPEWLVEKSSQVIGKGSGMPQIFNDECVIPALRNQGIEERDAYDYGVVGCVELSTQGNNLGWSDAAMFNLVKALELTLNNGVCLLTGKQLGPDLGNLADYPDFDSLVAAFRRQTEHFIERMIPVCDFVDRYHGESMPSPFLSSVIADCIERGTDVTRGGARYNLSGIQAIQAANVADSLAVIKELVFERREVGPGELLEALRTNWRGKEELRRKAINKVPKYGNDVTWVDELGAATVRHFADELKKYTNARGGPYHTGLYTVSAHIPMGKNVGASPDGRCAESPLADGGVSAMYGRDEHGPTALLRSVDRLDGRLGSNGSLLNMKFLPEFFQKRADRQKFNALLRGFCRLRINHVQFNVVRKEDLIDAQQNPDAYRGLTIRVAGYTAYFTELAPDLQDEIIARTSYGEID